MFYTTLLDSNFHKRAQGEGLANNEYFRGHQYFRGHLSWQIVRQNVSCRSTLDPLLQIYLFFCGVVDCATVFHTLFLIKGSYNDNKANTAFLLKEADPSHSIINNMGISSNATFHQPIEEFEERFSIDIEIGDMKKQEDKSTYQLRKRFWKKITCIDLTCVD